MKGAGFLSKTRLILWVFFDSAPNTVMRRLSFHRRRYIEHLKNRLLKTAIIKLNGGMFHCIDSESILILSHEFERWMWTHLNLKQGDVFVDVGAHIGKYTIPIAKIVGDKGLVIAVEPHPENYKTLVKNIKLNGLKNVVALNIAAWNGEGELKLFIGDKHGHHSVKTDFGLGFINVQARALDNLLNELKIKKVNTIKIDVEGAELEVLKGLVNTLEKHSPTIIVEVKKDPANVKEFINKKGYEMRQIAPEYYILEPRRTQISEKRRA